MKKQFIVFLASTILITSPVIAASSGSRNSLFKLPVRFNLFAGYQAAGGEFGDDKKRLNVNSYAVGLDYNVPIPQIHTTFGLQFNIVPSAKTGNSSRTLFGFLGLYGGYMNELNDIYLGYGYSSFNTYITENDASPNTEVDLKANPSCVFGGYRHYFKKGFSPGIGLSGFACSASSYTKQLDRSGTSTTVNSSANISGGMLSLFISWDDTTPLFLM